MQQSHSEKPTSGISKGCENRNQSKALQSCLDSCWYFVLFCCLFGFFKSWFRSSL